MSLDARKPQAIFQRATEPAAARQRVLPAPMNETRGHAIGPNFCAVEAVAVADRRNKPLAAVAGLGVWPIACSPIWGRISNKDAQRTWWLLLSLRVELALRRHENREAALVASSKIDKKVHAA